MTNRPQTFLILLLYWLNSLARDVLQPKKKRRVIFATASAWKWTWETSLGCVEDAEKRREIEKGVLGKHNWNVLRSRRPGLTERDQGYMVISVSFSLLCLNFCLLLPAEFNVDMWITKNTSSGQTDCLKSLNTHCSPQTHTVMHTQVLHQLPQRNASFTDGVRKYDASIMIPSWNFQLPLHPPFCISILRNRPLFLVPAAPSHLQHFYHHPFLFFSLHHPLVLAFFRVLIDGRGGHFPHPPCATTSTKVVFPHLSVLHSYQKLFPIAFFPLCFKVS